MADPRPDPVCYLCKRAEDNTLDADGMVTVELRPYGPQGEWVCYHCAMATPESIEMARKQLGARMGAIEAAGKTVAITDHGLVPFESEES